MSEHVRCRLYWFFVITSILCVYLIVDGKLHEREDELWQEKHAKEYKELKEKLGDVETECKNIRNPKESNGKQL